MQEARAAMGHLGVAPENILFLGLPDGGTGKIWMTIRNPAIPTYYAAGCGLIEEARRGAEEARRKLRAKPVSAGVRDVVIAPSNLFLTIHETVDTPLSLTALSAGRQISRARPLSNPTCSETCALGRN